MVKEIAVKLGGNKSSFLFKKIDRAKLYGRKRRIPLDVDGQPCKKAQLLEDGSLLLRSGMTGQGYFDDSGAEISQGDMYGLDKDGNILDKQPSTLGIPQDLVGPITPEDVLNLELTTIYHLTPSVIDDDLKKSLSCGDIYRFDFNYFADFRTERGIILKNQYGYFVLVGVPKVPTWSELSIIPDELFESDDTDDNADIDFEMF